MKKVIFIAVGNHAWKVLSIITGKKSNETK